MEPAHIPAMEVRLHRSLKMPHFPVNYIEKGAKYHQNQFLPPGPNLFFKMFSYCALIVLLIRTK